MSYRSKYRCRSCRTGEKWLPERPLQQTARVRTGCNVCERLTTHTPVGAVGVQ